MSVRLLRACAFNVLLAAMLGLPGPLPAKAEPPSPFDKLAGRWVGEGRFGSQGRHHGSREMPRDLHPRRRRPQELKQSIRCASAGGNVEIQSAVTHKDGDIAGTWKELVRDMSGEVTGTVTPERLPGRRAGRKPQRQHGHRHGRRQAGHRDPIHREQADRPDAHPRQGRRLARAFVTVFRFWFDHNAGILSSSGSVPRTQGHSSFTEQLSGWIVRILGTSPSASNPDHDNEGASIKIERR